MAGENYIGSKISLISLSDIRYVGILHSINAQDSTVGLKQVRSFGTEGRRGKPDEEIFPSDNVFDYVVFRGSDIKDLQVFEAPPPTNQLPPDPAIMSMGPPPPVYPPYIQPTASQVEQVQKETLKSEQVDTDEQVVDQLVKKVSKINTVDEVTSKEEERRPQRRGSRQQYRQHNKAFVIPNSEFDFEASNAKFDKNEMNQEELDNEASEPEGFYDKKSSFFDNISCESKERSEQNEPRRGRFHEERKLNMETFGQSTAAQSRYRNNKGRGRGNHRGGYYRYNNNGGYNNRQQQN